MKKSGIFGQTSIVSRSRRSLLTICIAPLLLVVLIASNIWFRSITDRTNELMESQMDAVAQTLEDGFNNYDELFKSIYTNQEWIERLEKLNTFNRQDYYLARRWMKRELDNLGYLYPRLAAIGIYTKKKEIVYFDTRTRMSTQSVYFSRDISEWEETARQSFSNVGTVCSRPVEMTDEDGAVSRVLYLARRISDFERNSDREQGSIILCIREENIRRLYDQQGDTSALLSLLCSEKGQVLSATDESCFGASVWTEELTDPQDVHEAVLAFARRKLPGKKLISAYERELSPNGFWQIKIRDRAAMLKDLYTVIRIILTIALISVLFASVFALDYSSSIETSIGRILSAMKQAREGDYEVRLDGSEQYEEFGKISDNFNYMVAKIGESSRKQREALLREKAAELSALEAQINPHFLYNTLDAINWIAIGNGQFQISRMLVDLGAILRYSIRNSNASVLVRDSVENIKKYVELQQERFDYSFQFHLEVDPDAERLKTHKLLVQPLIENAINHGFPGNTDQDAIWVRVVLEEGALVLEVRDNGVGMPPEMVQELNAFDWTSEIDRNEKGRGIGTRNVLQRFKYYYEDHGTFIVDSSSRGTCIRLTVADIASFQDERRE